MERERIFNLCRVFLNLTWNEFSTMHNISHVSIFHALRGSGSDRVNKIINNFIEATAPKVISTLQKHNFRKIA